MSGASPLNTHWGSDEGSAAGQFYAPYGVAVDSAGRIYIADTFNHRIQVLSSSGAYLTQWGAFGTAEGEFDSPIGVALDDSGNVYVTDSNNSRIQKFAPLQVLLVHGICGSATNWNVFAPVLRDSGYAVHTIQYGDTAYSAPPDSFLSVLATKLDSLGTYPVAIVAHSMGGLIARKYMKQRLAAGSVNPVRDIVTLGTPHHGSDFNSQLAGIIYLMWGWCAINRPGDSNCDPYRVIGKHVTCQGDRRSSAALLAMMPGAAFLNDLNYGTSTGLYDASRGRGWDIHQPETLVNDVYHGAIAGTRSICEFGDWLPLAPLFWRRGGVTYGNDGVVAVSSALLANTSAFGSVDADLPAGHLTHARGPQLCGKTYMESDTLAGKVARLLARRSIGPPVLLKSSGGVETMAAEESLQVMPAFGDSISAGRVGMTPVVVPASALLTVVMASNDAALSLVMPNATVITPSDTSTVNGVEHFGDAGGGFEGFVIRNPMAGTWNVRADATGASAFQYYTCLVSYSAPYVTRVEMMDQRIYPGDNVRVRCGVLESGMPRVDVSWICYVIGPDSVAVGLSMYDDGAHGDSLSGDGIFGNIYVPTGGFGRYSAFGVAMLPGGEALSEWSTCELIYWDDLVVEMDDIQSTLNVVRDGDSVAVVATVHNEGSRAALGVPVEVFDGARLLGKTTLDIPAGEAASAQVPWKVAAPDTHVLRVRVSPFVFPSEADLGNNAADRLVVLGVPIGVDHGRASASGLWMAPPSPNPASGNVLISFGLPVHGPVALEIFDVLGRRICRWRWEDHPAGVGSVEWRGKRDDGGSVAPGVFMCRLIVGESMLVRKLILRR